MSINTDKPANQPPNDLDQLASALLLLQTSDEVQLFLRDLLTPGEIKTLSERWRVAQLLSEGSHSYREISERTGASTTTVTRVSRFLSQEPWQGYQIVLDRQKGSQS
jgi:TrpR-related protein YerC/YecD